MEHASQYIVDEAAMLAFGAHLAVLCTPPSIIYLQGQLGSGKTTLTRGILRALGVTERVKSPTYSLIEGYALEKFWIYHYDLYRLSAPEELLDLGVDDYCREDTISIIEWPENGGSYLPKPDLIIDFCIQEQGRELQLHGATPIGVAMVTQLTKG